MMGATEEEAARLIASGKTGDLMDKVTHPAPTGSAAEHTSRASPSVSTAVDRSKSMRMPASLQLVAHSMPTPVHWLSNRMHT